jgi:hypothetical protein
MSRQKTITPRGVRRRAKVLLIFRRPDIVSFRRPDGRIFIGCVMQVFPEKRKVLVWSESVDLQNIVARVDAITRPPQTTPAELIRFPAVRTVALLAKGGA